jgi:hypothetical protein
MLTQFSKQCKIQTIYWKNQGLQTGLTVLNPFSRPFLLDNRTGLIFSSQLESWHNTRRTSSYTCIRGGRNRCKHATNRYCY